MNGGSPRTPKRERASPVVAVVERVAAADGVDPTDLPPLDDRVDADALDQLLTDAAADVTVEFEYAGYTVVARSGGAVDVRE